MRRRKRSAPTVSFEAYGVQLELAFDDPELEPRIREILPPGYRACKTASSTPRFALRETGRDAYEVTIGGTPAVEHASLEVALTLLDSQMRLSIAANARDLLFVHAGVVARGDRALVIPGGSFTGKTTLVQALVHAGAAYYSDEYAVLDDAGLIRPYPRPLSIRADDADGTRERRVDLIGNATGEERATLAVVAVTRYRKGAEWEPTRMSPGHGLLALLTNAVPAQERPAATLRTLRAAAAGATMLEGDRGEAGPTARALLATLEA